MAKLLFKKKKKKKKKRKKNWVLHTLFKSDYKSNSNFIVVQSFYRDNKKIKKKSHRACFIRRFIYNICLGNQKDSGSYTWIYCLDYVL